NEILVYYLFVVYFCYFFFQAEDGIRDRNVTGVQTCALPIFLASYMREKSENESLEDHLDKIVFKDVDGKEIYPDRLDVEGFEEFIERYKKGLVIEETAVNHLILSEQEE